MDGKRNRSDGLIRGVVRVLGRVPVVVEVRDHGDECSNAAAMVAVAYGRAVPHFTYVDIDGGRDYHVFRTRAGRVMAVAVTD